MKRIIEKNSVVFEVEALGEESWSVLGPEGIDGNELDWPTEEEVSTAIGQRVVCCDYGDHPTRSEALYWPI